MKLISLAITVLTLSAALWSQGGEGVNQCNWSFSVQDNNCTDGTCVSNTFTAGWSDSQYELKCGLQQCTGNCRVTVTLARAVDAVVIATCDNQNGQGDCNPMVTPIEGIRLEERVLYRVTVCLNPCWPDDCSACSGCTAQVMVCHP